MISVAKSIEEKIRKIKEGETFTYKELQLDQKQYQSATKSIERLINKGVIKRISPGVFFKPRQTIFGELSPNNEELIKPYLFNKGKRIAYVTGSYLYNKLGLTSQVPQIIKVASFNKEIKVNKQNIKIKPAKSYVEVTNRNYQYLEILDAIKDFKKIPDINPQAGIKVLLKILNNLGHKEINKIIQYSLNYPPRTRALLGALLENLGFEKDLEELKSSLNPLSEYALGINKEMLETAENWNIK